MESKQRIQHNTCMSSRGETKAGKKSNRFKKYVTIISQSFTLYTLKSYCLSTFIMPFCGKQIYIVYVFVFLCGNDSHSHYANSNVSPKS